MNQIDRLMHALVEAEAGIDTPPHVEHAVLAAWDAAHGEVTAAAGRRPSTVRVLLPLAAALMLAAALGVHAARTMRAAPVARPAQTELSSTPLPAVTLRSSTPPPSVAQPASARVTPSAPPRAVRAARAPRTATAGDDASGTVVLIGEPVTMGEPVRVVRMRVPRSALSAMGIRSLAAARADRVDLDVLVGEDGVARAIRVGM